MYPRYQTPNSPENVDLSTLHIRMSCRRVNSPGFRALPVLTYENLDGKIAVWVWLCVPPYSLMCCDWRSE